MQLDFLKKELSETIRLYNQKGWSPATSTNYSFKDKSDQIWVSRSGIDKSKFTPEDFITIDKNGNSTGDYKNSKPSAETMIHCVIYRLFPKTQVILHSHGVYPVLLSAITEKYFEFEGFELQKGFPLTNTHEETVKIPVFENSQNMMFFDEELTKSKEYLNQSAFMIKKHGSYAWGENLFEAKRHLETLDYLCQCLWELKKY